MFSEELGIVLSILILILQISKKNEALKQENLALKAALVVSSSQVIRRDAPKFDVIHHFGENSSTSGRLHHDFFVGGDEAVAFFYESRLQSYQELLNEQVEARAKQVNQEKNFLLPYLSHFCILLLQR